MFLGRFYWGFQLAQNGWGKLHNLGRVPLFFSSLGLPAPGFTAAFIATIEFVGGILVAVGLFSSAVGLALTVEALFSIISDPDKFTAAAPYTTLFVALLILILRPWQTRTRHLAPAPYPYPTTNQPFAKTSV